MKLPLRYFLAFSILIGAIGLPLGWKWYQARRAEEIERLEKELAELRNKSYGPDSLAAIEAMANSDSQRISEIEDRLEKLTGKQPERPSLSEEDIMGGAE